MHEMSIIDPLNIAFVLDSSAIQPTRELEVGSLSSKFKHLQTTDGINIGELLAKEVYFDSVRGAKSFPVSKMKR